MNSSYFVESEGWPLPQFLFSYESGLDIQIFPQQMSKCSRGLGTREGGPAWTGLTH